MKKKSIITLMALFVLSINLLAEVYRGFDGDVNPPLENAIRRALRLQPNQPITTEALNRRMLELDLSNSDITTLAGFPEQSRVFRLNLSGNPGLTSLEGAVNRSNELLMIGDIYVLFANNVNNRLLDFLKRLR